MSRKVILAMDLRYWLVRWRPICLGPQWGTIPPVLFQRGQALIQLRRPNRLRFPLRRPKPKALPFRPRRLKKASNNWKPA